ncbi:hypothetical protein BLA29_015457, partial [Euroglyphus maynei]
MHLVGLRRMLNHQKFVNHHIYRYRLNVPVSFS